VLKIECYPVMNGLMVSLVGVDHSTRSPADGASPARVMTTIRTDTIENLGLEEALRDVLTDVIQEYPGLLSFALR
jgi:hypothetical protein